MFTSKINGSGENIGFQKGMSGCHQVLQGGQPGEQLYILKGSGDTELGNPVGRKPCDWLPIEINVAFLGAIVAIDTVEEGSLAGAVGSDYGQNFTLTNIHTYPVKGIHPTKIEVNIVTL